MNSPRLSFLFLCLLAASRLAQAQVTAFPGAYGFGATATGGTTLDGSGRHTGGNVYHVTNLNDSGAGSFRDAVSASGRIIVFDVGGYINLQSAVSTKGNLTIAGQTAPGGGIGFTGAEISFANQTNIICRFVRMRPGGSSSSTDDCVSLYRANTIIMDHCSLDFAKWNNIDAVGDSTRASTNFTVQNSIIADPIGQQFGAHTEMVGGFFSWFNNIFANGHNRQPLAKDNTIYINNTIYNFSSGYTTHTSTRFKHDIINNYFICGPASGSGGNAWFQIDTNQSMYYTGNLLDNDHNSPLNGSTTEPYPGYQGTGTILASPWSSITTAYVSGTTLLSASNSVIYNMSNAGGLPHDDIESLVVSQVKTLGNGATGTGVGTAGPSGGLYTSQTQTGLSNNGFGTIAGGTPPIDSDQDGMPDDWEIAKGLNANSAADGKTTAASGYTNLEDYLNWLALPHAFVAKNTAAQPSSVDIDLRKYADGFPTGATFTVSAVTGGTASQSGTGGYLVHYVPTVNTGPAVGGFTFSVTNGSYTMTKSFGVLISQIAATQDLLWKGGVSSNTWDTSVVNWVNQNTAAPAAYGVADRVTFDDTGSHSPSVNITAVISPSSIEVNTDQQNYTFAGNGWISGATALVKNGQGTLTIAPTSISTTGTLTGGSPVIPVASTANLIVGMSVSGAAVSGSTTIPSSTSLIAINSGSSSVTLSKNANVTTVTTLTFTPVNNYTGPTTFNAGTILLNGGGSLGSGVLNLYSTLTNNAGVNSNASISNSVVISSGVAATINMGNRFSLGGSVSGGGTLNLNVQTAVSRDDLTGSFSGFTGTLNFLGSGGARLFMNGGSFDNFGNAFVNLGASVNFQPQTNSGGNTITVGELSGAGTLFGGTVGTATWSFGGLNTSSTFSGTIQGNSAVTKTGTGTLTLSGSMNYTGATTISAGTLAAAGPFGGPVILSSGTFAPIGVVSASNGFTFSGGSINYDLSNSPAGANEKITVASGTLTLSSAGSVKLNLVNGYLGSGVYFLIDGSSTMSASNTTPTFATNPVMPSGSRQSLVIGRGSNGGANGFLKITVTGDVAALTWTGSNGGIWDLSTTQSWSSAAPSNPNLFYNFDIANFTDSAANGTVTLNGSVQPNTVNVTANSTAYNFTGTGSIDGSAKLIKSGSGALTISTSGTNSFSGGTILNAGTLSVASLVNGLGTGVVTVNGGVLNLQSTSLSNSMIFSGSSAITSSGNVTIISSTSNTLSSSGTATVNLSGLGGILTIGGDMSGFTGTFAFGSNGGMLRLNGNTNACYGSASALFDLGTGSATLCNRNGDISIDIGALQGGSNTWLTGRQSGSAATSTNYTIGALDTDNTFAGHISNAGDTNGVNITKVGAGNWTLSGSSNFIGSVLVQEGTLTVSGFLANNGDFEIAGSTVALSGGTITTPVVTVDGDATLTGCGTINGAVVSQGVVLIGCGGALTVNGDLENDGTMRVTNGSALQVSGTFTNTGLLDMITGLQNLPANFVNTGIVVDASSVRVSQFTKSGSTFSVSLPASYLGHNYQLQYRSSLSSGSWSTVDTKAGTGDPLASPPVSGALSLSDTHASGICGFYRVLVSP